MRKFKEIEKCGCGQEYSILPDVSKYFEDDAFGGWYWDCMHCGSTHLTKEKKLDPILYCDCDDCTYDPDKACAGDCGSSEECMACLEFKEEKEERDFEISRAQGIF